MACLDPDPLTLLNPDPKHWLAGQISLFCVSFRLMVGLFGSLWTWDSRGSVIRTVQYRTASFPSNIVKPYLLPLPPPPPRLSHSVSPSPFLVAQ
jgi:hypothetical protein